MPSTIVETDAFPTTLTAPAAGEPASAVSLLSQFLQPAANRLRYLYNRVNKLTAGGTFANVSAVVFSGDLSAGGLLSAGSGMAVTGNANVSGYVRQTRRIVQGDGSTGTHLFNTTDNEHVYAANSTVGSGCIWKITDAVVNQPIRFFNFDYTNAIVIQDPAGTSIASIKAASGFTAGVTVVFNGSVYFVMDATYR